MGYLEQSPSIIPNFTSFSISMWFRIPGLDPVFSSGVDYHLFEIFDYDWSRQLVEIGIQSAFDGSGYHQPQLYAGFQAVNPFAEVTGGFMLSGPFVSGGVHPAFGQWHHAFIAIDLSGAGTISAPTGFSPQIMFPARMVLDGVSCAQGYNPHNGSILTPNYIFSSPDCYAPSTVYSISSDLVKVGLPYVSDNVGTDGPGSRARDYGDFQAWFGQFIDPTVPANFAKFVSISGGKGTPVDPAIAAAAFGQQSILFKGKSSDASFFVNHGTAGSFTKVGTASDFTPAPSFG